MSELHEKSRKQFQLDRMIPFAFFSPMGARYVPVLIPAAMRIAGKKTGRTM